MHIPCIKALKKETLKKVMDVFDEFSKIDVKPLYDRILKRDPVQRVIDELALEMLGLEDWKVRLDEIYDAIAKELQTMHKILETSRRKTKKSKITQATKEKTETSLKRWL